jgi:hypothetical protein
MKPIIFSTPMVQAILDGRKTQTRRIVKPQPSSGIRKSVFVKSGLEDGHGREIKPRYQPSDILWVRETWYYEEHMHDLTEGEPDLASGRYSHRYVYKADNRDYPVNVGVGEHGWKPSIHMPREAARIFLQVTNVRVERLQDITEEDAIAEGMSKTLVDGVTFISAKGKFHALWDTLYAKCGYSWENNPWVWVYEFMRIK